MAAPRLPDRLALALLALAAGCRSERGAIYDCSCAMLTDYDDGSRRIVEVCAASADRAPAVARGCAQSAAPAPIQECECRRAEAPPGGSAARDCAAGECRAR